MVEQCLICHGKDQYYKAPVETSSTAAPPASTSPHQYKYLAFIIKIITSLISHLHLTTDQPGPQCVPVPPLPLLSPAISQVGK